DAPHDLGVTRRTRDRALDVRRRDGVATGAEGVLGIVEHPYVEPSAGPTYPVDGVHERRDRSVALAAQLVQVAVDVHVDVELVLRPGRRGGVDRVELERGLAAEVLVGEDLPDLGWADLAALGVGALLDDPGELDLRA